LPALEAVRPQRVSQRCSESFQVSSNPKMLNVDTMDKSQQLLRICSALPTSAIVAEAGTLRCLLVSSSVSGLAFLIRTKITDPSRHVSASIGFNTCTGFVQKEYFYISLLSLKENIIFDNPSTYASLKGSDENSLPSSSAF